MADTLDLSRRSIQNILISLLQKGYIDRSDGGAVKPSDLIRAVATEHDAFMILIKTEGIEVAIDKIKEWIGGVQNLHGGVQNLHGGGAKFALEGVQNLHPSTTDEYISTVHISAEAEKPSDLKTIEIGKQFYTKEYETWETHKFAEQYKSFVRQIFDTNPLGKPQVHVLKVEQQLTFPQFVKLMETVGGDSGFVLIIDKLNLAINTPKYLSGKKSLYLTIDNWLKKDRR